MLGLKSINVLKAMYLLVSSIPYSTISEICNSFCLFTFCCSHLRLYSSLVYLKKWGTPLKNTRCNAKGGIYEPVEQVYIYNFYR